MHYSRWHLRGRKLFAPNAIELVFLTIMVATEEEAEERIRSDHQTYIQETLLIGTSSDDQWSIRRIPRPSVAA